MNKATLIAKVAESQGLSKKETEAIFNDIINTIVDTVNSGEKVQIVGFGTFEVKTRAGRICKIPGTDTEVTVPDSKIPTFKAGRVFKDKVR